MKISNPFQINDWEIKKFLKVILAIQLALWGATGVDAIGLQIPLIRQLIGLVYLTFIPGILILRVLKLHKLGNIETLLYTVGLSIATLMLTGLFMNTAYPFFGISRPISIMPLIITISVVVLVLCVISYIRDRDFFNPDYIDIKEISSPPALLLCLIPFLSIFGTYLANFYHNNTILMFLIIIIVLIAILISFDRFIPKNLYPLAVLMIAIALLYHTSLISMYLWGWDIHGEYHLANIVIGNSYWDSTVPSNTNAMLSIVMLAPIFSDVCNMSLTWVFKIIYPLLFSLIPLGLYRVFQKQTNDKIAFLSCFFFMSMFTFCASLPALARQEIAELFLVLLMLLMIDKGMNKIKRSFLFIVFGISLVVSHYGLSYIYMFCLISGWLILVLMDSPTILRLIDNFYTKFGRARAKLAVGNPIPSKIEDRTISSTFVLLFVVFTLTWYMHVSTSSAFNTIVGIGNHIASSIFTDFLNPETVEGLYLIKVETVSPLHNVTKYIHLLSQFFIFVGVITLILNRKGMKFEREYVAFLLVNFVICLGGITLPYFAGALNTNRLYHITLIFLAPLCVIGGITVLRLLSKIVKIPWTDQSVKKSLKVLSVFFALSLLFTSGFVYEVAKDHPTSISLSMKSMADNTQDLGKRRFDVDYIYEQEVFSAIWISKRRDGNTRICTQYATNDHVLHSYGMLPRYSGPNLVYNRPNIEQEELLYLGYLNVVYGVVIFLDPKKYETIIGNTTDISPPLEKMSEIYSNGGSEIYYYE